MLFREQEMMYNHDTSIADATLWHRKQAFRWDNATSNATLASTAQKKRNRKVPVPLGLGQFILLKVALQEAFQCSTMSGLITNYSKKPLKIQGFFT